MNKGRETEKLTADEIHALATSPLPVLNIVISDCFSCSRGPSAVNKYHNNLLMREYSDSNSRIIDSFQQSNSKNF